MTDLHDTVVYRYGLLDPLDWDEDCREQLWLQNRLWNSLVEIERDTRARYREITGSHADIAPLERERAELKARQQELREHRKMLRKAARKKVPTPEIDAELRDLAARIQPLSERIRETRAVVRSDLAEPLTALERERVARVEQARKTSGLWWPNANAVIDAYSRARGKAMQDGAELQFHRFTGEGRFSVQLIGGRSTEYITSGRCSQVAIDLDERPIPGRKGKPRPTLAIAVYMRDREPRLLHFPLIYDRPLPTGDNVSVQDVTLTRRRVGTRFVHHVVFRLRVPAQPFARPVSDRACAINLGFRQRPDSTLRIGMLADARGFRELTLPTGVLRTLDRLDDLRAARDTHMDAVVARLRAAWPDRPDGCPEILGERVNALLRAPKFGTGKLASVVLMWRNEYGDYWPEMREALEAWRRADKLAYEREANERAQILAQRTEHYRRLAREIAAEYGEIRIGEIKLREMAQLERPSGEETELHARARRNRQRAALYTFQQELARQALKSGSTLITVRAPYTPVCGTCGETMAVGADLMVSCSHGHVWDQDEVAARNILAASSEHYSAYEDATERSRKREQALARMRERLARMQAARRAKRSRGAVQASDSGVV